MLKKTRNFSLRKFSTTTQCLKITKSRIQHCERSELPLHFEWIKAKNGQFGDFKKT